MAITTVTKALRKLYKSVTGEETNKISPTKIISDLADNYSGGGGGASDFTTAEVTVSMSAGIFTLPVVVSGTSDEMSASGCAGYPISTENGGTYTVALYKGSAVGLFISDTNALNVRVTGNIVYQEGAFLITGDGTITVTAHHIN